MQAASWERAEAAPAEPCLEQRERERERGREGERARAPCTWCHGDIQGETARCSLQVVQQTVPPELNITVTTDTLDGLAVAELAEGPPPDTGLCNADLPSDSVLSRYVWVADTFARNGAPCCR